MKDVFVRPLEPGDVVQFDRLRRLYKDADLELPKDFNSRGVLSVCATKNHKPIAALTGIHSVVLDPFIHDPEANPTDLLFALVKMESVLTFWGMQNGAVDAHLAIPKQLSKYGRLLQNYGFQETVQNCHVMRRPLLPDFIPLIGPERDRAEVEANAPTK